MVPNDQSGQGTVWVGQTITEISHIHTTEFKDTNQPSTHVFELVKKLKNPEGALEAQGEHANLI